MDSLKSCTAQNMNDMNDNDIHKDDIITLEMENLLKIGQPRSMGGRVETDMRASHPKASPVIIICFQLSIMILVVIALIYLTFFRGQEGP